MVVGGRDSTGRTDKVELVSLDPGNHPVPECLKQLANYPVALQGAAGASLQFGSRKHSLFSYEDIQTLLLSQEHLSSAEGEPTKRTWIHVTLTA